MLNAKGIKAVKFKEKILRKLVWEMLISISQTSFLSIFSLNLTAFIPFALSISVLPQNVV